MGLDEGILNTSRWETIRNKAIANWDGRQYCEACDVLGLEPEFDDLYSLGIAEKHSIIFPAKEKISDKYSNFYREGIVLNENDFRADIDEKKRLLLKFFPRRFGDEGKQPIADMEEAKAGRLFNHMIDYSKKKAI